MTHKSEHTDYSMVSSELKTVIAIARQAGEKIMAIYDRVSDEDDLTIQSKADHSPLTEADLAAHHCIIEGLKSLDPHTPLFLRSLPCPTMRSENSGLASGWWIRSMGPKNLSSAMESSR